MLPKWRLGLSLFWVLLGSDPDLGLGVEFLLVLGVEVYAGEKDDVKFPRGDPEERASNWLEWVKLEVSKDLKLLKNDELKFGRPH